MSMYFWCDLWVYAENSEDLDKLTQKDLLTQADNSLFRYSNLLLKEGKSLIEEEKIGLKKAYIERTGKIEQKTPLMMKIHAGGNYGHCLDVIALSELYPKLLFFAIDQAECDEEGDECIVFNGKQIKGLFNDINNNLDQISFSQVKNILDLAFLSNSNNKLARFISIIEDEEVFFLNEND